MRIFAVEKNKQTPFKSLKEAKTLADVSIQDITLIANRLRTEIEALQAQVATVKSNQYPLELERSYISGLTAKITAKQRKLDAQLALLKSL